jgi:integrase
MARAIGKLSAVAVNKAKRKGLYADGGGLYLRIAEAGSKSWVFRFMRAGRARAMGLGPLDTVSLAEAREVARECRKLCREDIDPIEARKAKQAEAKLEAANTMTFRQCAESYIEAHGASWRNPKHASQWPNTLAAYVYPVFGAVSVQAVDVGLVMKAVEPIWHAKPETASRVRGRIESVLDWASARGYRRGDNPARWRGHLENLLPNRSKLQRVEHHAALPYAQMAEFMAALRVQEGIAARALEFLILTAARTGEVIGASPSEIKDDVWTVPAERMKGGKEHRIPLSAPALEIIEKMKMEHPGNFLFPGAKRGKPLSNMGMTMTLRRMERGDLTVHGFRSTFRDWSAERTNFPREVAEMALAHTVTDKVEAAYRRGDLFEKRRHLMASWASFATAPKTGAKVVSIGSAR